MTISMKKKRRFVLVILLVTFWAVLNNSGFMPGLFAGEEPLSSEEEILNTGRRCFWQAREVFYRNEVELTAVEELLAKSKQAFQRLKDDYLRYYWLAETRFLEAELARTREDRRLIALRFEESGQLAKKALKYNKNSSNALRLLAGTYTQLISYKGVLYAISHGFQAERMLKKALRLDRTNYTAYNSLASYYIFLPSMYGGSAERAIGLLNEALASDDHYDNFYSYLWLGFAYNSLGKQEEAAAGLRRALEIYPRNPWANALLRSVEAGDDLLAEYQ